MKTLRWKPFYSLVLIAIMLISWVAPGKATAQLDPRFGVYVQDEANVLSEQAQVALYQKAVWLESKTGGAQVGILTVPDLDGNTLEGLAVERFRKMELGNKAANNGVLILYTAKENHVRIEVGYGLEGRITDGKAGAILDQYFVPSMKAGLAEEAFADTQLALISEAAAEYGVDITDISQGMQVPQVGNGSSSADFFDSIPGFVKVIIGIGLVILIFLDFKFTGGLFTFGLLSMFRGGSRGGGGSWGGRGGGGSSGGGGASR